MPIREPISIQGHCTLGQNLDTGPFVVLRDCVIGDNVRIWAHTTVDPDAVIGNNVTLHNHVYVCQGTIIEDDVYVGPGVVFLNDKYPPRYDPTVWRPPIIRKGAIIGGGARILPGVVVEERAIIAAGAVVTKSVPSRQLWAGFPAGQFVQP